jgi:hypothetical protein
VFGSLIFGWISVIESFLKLLTGIVGKSSWSRSLSEHLSKSPFYLTLI